MILQKSNTENQYIDFNKIYTSKEGSIYKIIEVKTTKSILIEFLDDYKYSYYVQLVNIKSGQIKNPYFKSVYGVGFLGVGKYKASINRKCTKIYHTWKGVLERSYSSKLHIKHPSYVGCSVSPEWHNFQNFAKWFEENYREGYQLDKDILIKGNKIYSPETCCFVPDRINTLILNHKSKRGKLPVGVYSHRGTKFQASCNTGDDVKYLGHFDTPEDAFKEYKRFKENYIESVAYWYFKDDLITEKVYNSLANWEININD